ncbi:helix-turn-helix domain-containing protein [Streptomyces sp. NPDC060035]|uniref:helix-turn-helix domain-containing protein n=1 Tax=Streptomyces sp. NPDC060035 TaxID=3347044 RepID=UPI003678DCE0
MVVREPAQGSASTQLPHQGADCPADAGAPATFGQLLRAHRMQRGLSLAQFAGRVHFNRGHISKVETDKRTPSVSFAEACDRVLNVGYTFTTIASALEATTRQQQGWVQPAQLPATKRNFVGRRDCLSRLNSRLQDHAQSLAVPVAVINGPPGVGKTALAVQWAHQAVSDGHFADGQLFVNLEGPELGTAAAPFDVLEDLLRAVGVPTERIPEDLGQRAATFRSYLHGREILLVLDNAADAQQIYHLLPGSPGCAVVVTSRSRLPGLLSRVDAVTLPLTELCRPEAATLIRAMIGDVRADADPAAVTVLAERCGHLPLAMVLAAEHIVSQQHRSADTLATELKTEHARLNLAEGDVVLRTTFDTSYKALDEQSARMFRLLGLLPGQLIDAAATASTAGFSQDEALRLLDSLASAHLIRRQDERHYFMHDLLRAYAADLARQLDGEPERAQPMRLAADPVSALDSPALSSLIA